MLATALAHGSFSREIPAVRRAAHQRATTRTCNPPMPIVMIEHAVPSFEKWKEAFDRDPANRKESGVRRYEIYRLSSEPNHVLVDLEFDTMNEAEAFVRKMEPLWEGALKDLVKSPRWRIADVVEARSP
jgi:hypothetical protein